MNKKYPGLLLLSLFLAIANPFSGHAGTLSDTVPSNWITYTNAKLGLSFSHPATWTPYGSESNSVDRKGNLLSVIINFTDTVSDAHFSLEYHVAPYGAQLYRFAKDEFNASKGKYATGRKQMNVAGRQALTGTTVMTKDIKGNTIYPALKIMVVDLPDKQGSGEIQLQFKTPLATSDAELAKFGQVLSSFTFAH